MNWFPVYCVRGIATRSLECSAHHSAPFQPKLWLRYVDDIFVLWQYDKIGLNEFLQHLNNQHCNIKFTMEVEQQQSISFLDILVTKAPNGKPTRTDRFLNYCSFHHPSTLQSVSSTLVRCACTISDKYNLHRKLRHITNVLKFNGYPTHKIITKPPRGRDPTPEARACVILPFIG